MKSRTSDTHSACRGIRRSYPFSMLRGMLRTWELRAQSTDSGQGSDVMWHLMCFKENSYRMCLSSGEVFNCRRGKIKCNRSVFTPFNHHFILGFWLQLVPQHTIQINPHNNFTYCTCNMCLLRHRQLALAASRETERERERDHHHHHHIRTQYPT